MNYWLFQGNPDYFDVDSYLQQTSSIYWSAVQYQNNIKIGDPVFIWRAKGSTTGPWGIVALGAINETCKHRAELDRPINLYDNLWRTGQDERSEKKVGVTIEEYRLTTQANMIESKQIDTHPTLYRMQIRTSRVGSNFRLSFDQYRMLRNLWDDNGPDRIAEESLFSEGRIYYRLHQIRERNPAVVSAAKERFLRLHGRYFCEICDFSSEDEYGILGRDVIEVHHKTPTAEMRSDSRTSVEDLMMVCANCHSILHRGNPAENLQYLTERFARD